LTIDIIEKRIHALRKSGIKVGAYFIIGFPGETREEIKETIDLALRLPLNFGYFSILFPLPGTKIYNDIYHSEPIDINTLASLNFQNYENNLSEVASSELRKILKKAFLTFHIRPRILVNFLLYFNSISKLKFLASRLNRFMSH
jgi:radical SAM superfamily enzyme YgiQ (UPF0313 family)